jgi:hypothetical protein
MITRQTGTSRMNQKMTLPDRGFAGDFFQLAQDINIGRADPSCHSLLQFILEEMLNKTPAQGVLWLLVVKKEA